MSATFSRWWAKLDGSPWYHGTLCIACLVGAALAAWTPRLWLLLFDGGAALVAARNWQRALAKRRQGRAQ